ncbi:hypothetical protein V8G54_034011 [Vigna mungo]|uniref:Retrotransposon Copia-like N-terminal domain-containing protein n=1 Tax=Vigna mungo TaxID=3915 RepID=A0AAQ3RGV1_VIGMU
MSEDYNNSSSFLYLHPGESLTISLVSPLLKSNNYHAWSKSMFTALSAKNKKEDATHNAWKRCNNMVVSWLVHSISPEIRHNILWMESAQAIWDDLKSRFFQGDLLRISTLQNEAACLHQGDSTVTEFFTKLRIIWDEPENFHHESVCSCEIPCSCTKTMIIAQRKHEDRVLQFLRGLNEQYDPMPSISKIFSYVVQQERQVMNNNFLNALETKSMVVVNSVSCSYCGKNGHTESICFKKNGFPINKNSTNHKTCSHCGKISHIIEVFYKKDGFPPGHRLHNGKSFMSRNQKTRTENQEDAPDHEVQLTISSFDGSYQTHQ